MTCDELRARALQALRIADPEHRCAAVRELAAGDGPVDAQAAIEEPAGVPGRPARPLLVAPGQLRPRSPATAEGHAALLHALAHIEFNAIGLALDHLWRFAGLPEAYYRDWAGVAAEEATHFMLLRDRLRATGHDYGDFPAHDGLWEMARRTAGDALARMALVPRTLEARGLDASPAVRAKLAAVGDQASARVIDIILNDEIGHVAIGNRWFHHLCARGGLDPSAAHRQAALRYEVPRQRGTFNVPARLRAGFSADELRQMQSWA
jgi:uncharacterized ferritin-like protein (DUF455 family)